MKINEFNEIQAMLDGAQTLRKDSIAKEKAATDLHRQINKRKYNIISNFMFKKPCKD